MHPGSVLPARPLALHPVPAHRTVTPTYPGIRASDRYLWDNWAAHHNGELFRFALQAPRFGPGGELLDPESRHLAASIAGWRFTGHGYEEYGTLLAPRSGDPEAFDHTAVWSGSALSYRGRFLLAYTGVRLVGDEPLQTIGLAEFDPATGRCRRPARPLLAPDPAAHELGYFTGASPHGIMAWRDPFLWHDDEAGELHVFFAAHFSPERAAEAGLGGDPGALSTIGHAILDPDDPFGPVHLQPWLNLPGSWHQMELPVMERGPDGLRLHANTVTFDDQGRRHQALRSWRAMSPGESWQNGSAEGDLCGTLTGIYGQNFVRDPGTGRMLTMHFSEDDFSLSPLVPRETTNRAPPQGGRPVRV